MPKRALVVQGGWDGHQPKEVSDLLAGLLRDEQFDVDVYDTLACLTEVDLATVDLIVPMWTMGTIEPSQLNPLLEAVKNGTGVAGCHGGMGDAFRNETEYQYMVGGQWVAHPGNDGVHYTVHIEPTGSAITEGVGDFDVVSEKYYMHIDPVIDVLATTDFDGVKMPVAWTKMYGGGKVFYCSLGHQANIVAMPQVLTLMRRGMVWAAR